MTRPVVPSIEILAFGDSNTYGQIPLAGRYDAATRWPGVLKRLLGETVLVTEEGLPGRTFAVEDPHQPGAAGLPVLAPVLMSHGPLDLLIVMLGTNDCKMRLGRSPAQIAADAARLMETAKALSCWRSKPEILLVAPAPIADDFHHTPFVEEMGEGCVEKSLALGTLLAKTAQQQTVSFLDSSTLPGVEVSQTDGIHLSAAAHLALAEGIAAWITKQDFYKAP